MLIREKYLDRLRQLQDQKIIKVITGVRRCGKSTILELFRDDFPKTIITRDTVAENFDGIKKVNVVDWLLKRW